MRLYLTCPCGCHDILRRVNRRRVIATAEKHGWHWIKITRQAEVGRGDLHARGVCNACYQLRQQQAQDAPF